MATPEQLADEAKRARKVRQLVDVTTSLIMQSRMPRKEAEALVEAVRGKILELFPDAEETYEVIYSRRFRRIIDEYAGPDAPPRSVVIPFPPPRF
jgi:hypothetical protein